MTVEPHGAEPFGGQYHPAPAGDPKRTATRASTADREQANTLLSAAMAVGAITPEEYSERAADALSAVTLADLDVLCADLPLDRLGAAVAAQSTGSTRVSRSGAGPVRKATAVFSSSRVGGGAVVADGLTARSVFGGVEIDLRDVEFTADELVLDCRAYFGTIEVIVPDDVTVEVHGSGIVGGFDGGAAGAGQTGAPRVVIRGRAVFGSVETRRAARGQWLGPARPK
ncbi:DUF1707 domain-containing protein [Gordonia sp. VNK21]|uniref:DUF1707 SHOCT-like domain-containing protein n=1 Tax=Gordonia sp. VNK21 TaxID=3382483 RepID=UPI0038D42D4C